MEISLLDEERQLLEKLLESHITDLRGEIYHAESHDVKADLKRREGRAVALLERLQGAPVNIAVG